MKITVHSRGNVSIDLREVDNACRFFADKLLRHSPHKIDSLDVEIELVDRNMVGGRDGMCFCDDLDCDYPEFFSIHIANDLDEETVLTVLAHEMVHVKQYTMGELREMGDDVCWSGVLFGGDPLGYWEQPWEIEAFGREVGLISMYKAERYGRMESFTEKLRDDIHPWWHPSRIGDEGPSR